MTNADEDIGCRYLRADSDENPFVIDGYDCRRFVQSMLSASSDPSVAASFVSLRPDNGGSYVGQLPTRAVELNANLDYPLAHEVGEGPVFKAREME